MKRTGREVTESLMTDSKLYITDAKYAYIKNSLCTPDIAEVIECLKTSIKLSCKALMRLRKEQGR